MGELFRMHMFAKCVRESEFLKIHLQKAPYANSRIRSLSVYVALAIIYAVGRNTPGIFGAVVRNADRRIYPICIGPKLPPSKTESYIFLIRE